MCKVLFVFCFVFLKGEKAVGLCVGEERFVLELLGVYVVAVGGSAGFSFLSFLTFWGGKRWE